MLGFFFDMKLNIEFSYLKYNVYTSDNYLRHISIKFIDALLIMIFVYT